eukprot:10430367-Lingulodinium_polyedra.AAC.1
MWSQTTWTAPSTKTSRWCKIQKQDVKEVLLGGLISSSQLRSWSSADKDVIRKLFIYVTAMVGNEPIARGATHRTLQSDIKYRIAAVGSRIGSLVAQGKSIMWQGCGPWQVKQEGSKLK